MRMEGCVRIYTKKMARTRARARTAAAKLRAGAAQVDEMDEFPPELLELLWERGFLTMRVPKKYGGAETGLAEACIIIEELARGSGTAALIVLLQGLAAEAIQKYASEKQASEWFEKIVHHRQTIAFALSEPDDESALMTTARKDKSGYVIQGRKTFVSGVREADMVMVFAVSNKKAGLRRALTAFMVPGGSAGMVTGRELSRAGLRGLPAVELLFEGCRVSQSRRIAGQGRGYAVAKDAIVFAAPLAAALSCGILAEALDHVVRFIREGREKPSPASESQALELSLAEMWAGLDSARALTWAAAGAVEEGVRDAERLAREAKWTAAETCIRSLDRAESMAGILGSIKGSALERLSRDARAAGLVLGLNHIHKIEVARKLAKA